MIDILKKLLNKKLFVLVYIRDSADEAMFDPAGIGGFEFLIDRINNPPHE